MHVPTRFGLATGTMLVLAAAAHGQTQPTREQIDQRIRDLQEALYAFQVDYGVFTLSSKAEIMDGNKRIDNPKRIEGNVIGRTAEAFSVRTRDGNTLTVPIGDMLHIQPPGHFQPDYYRLNNPGGYTAMALWALAASDAWRNQDPRFEKAMGSYIEGTITPGVYSLSLRLNTLAHMINWSSTRNQAAMATYRRLLARETDVMVRAMGTEGWYNYKAYPPPGWQETAPGSWRWTEMEKGRDHKGDNSNTQFAMFGVWASVDAGAEIPANYWVTVTQHWLQTQQSDGGWGYRQPGEKSSSTPNMTDAGLNSLYLALDKHWSRQGTAYRPLKGFTFRPEALRQIQAIEASLKRGFDWINAKGGKRGGHGLYHEYGLQRLGLMSGRKYIGDKRPWFEKVVQAAYGTSSNPGKDKAIEQLSWRLMCLAFGRAPILFNKLEHNDNYLDWNYYPRDIANLTGWIGFQEEKRFNWQIIRPDDALHDFLDAPFLYINGARALSLTAEQLAKIKMYADMGGTIILHPLHDSRDFKQSATTVFQQLWADEGLEWQTVPADHPVMVGPFRGMRPVTRLPVKALHDGGRFFCYLIEGDIAGAWQQHLTARYENYYNFMRYLRFFHAPEAELFPWQLRPVLDFEKQGANMATVARVSHNAGSRVFSIAYTTLRPLLARAGLGIELKDQAEATAEGLAGAKIIHITGVREIRMSPAQHQAIRQALEAGAFLVVDPAWGHPRVADSARSLIEAMGLSIVPVNRTETPVLAGVVRWSTNPAMFSDRRFGPQSGFFELKLSDKTVGIFCEVGLTAPAAGQWVRDQPAFAVETAQQVWVSIVNYVLNGRATQVELPASGEFTGPAPVIDENSRGDEGNGDNE
mgnify:CR=1 FL=1